MKNPELIIVACHAVFIGENKSDLYNDEKWILFPFQKGEPGYYIEHLKAGIDLLSKKENSVLIISGGKTRPEAKEISEAESYYKIAEIENWFGFKIKKDRVYLEEYARDSFENLLFSICRFYQLFNKHPLKIYMITWEFKKDRYDFHRKSIGISSDEFEFIGVNNPEDLDLAKENEKRTILEFKSDPFGIQGILKEKKHQRNPLNLIHPYSCDRFNYILSELKFK